MQRSRGLTPVVPGVTEKQVIGLGPWSYRLDPAAVPLQRRGLVRGVSNGRVGRRPPRPRRSATTAPTRGPATAAAARRGRSGVRRRGRVGRVRSVRRPAMDRAGSGTAGGAVALSGCCASHYATVGTSPTVRLTIAGMLIHRCNLLELLRSDFGTRPGNGRTLAFYGDPRPGPAARGLATLRSVVACQPYSPLSMTLEDWTVAMTPGNQSVALAPLSRRSARDRASRNSLLICGV